MAGNKSQDAFMKGELKGDKTSGSEKNGVM